MELVINNKKYIVEYSFEAALYEDCVTAAFNIFGGVFMAEAAQDMQKVIGNVANLPKKVVTLFYAGLLENNPVEDEQEAKGLLKQYFKEHKGEDGADFYGMIAKIGEQMREDGFFKQIGLEAMMTAAAEEMKKVPQDHKRKEKRQKQPRVLQN